MIGVNKYVTQPKWAPHARGPLCFAHAAQSIATPLKILHIVAHTCCLSNAMYSSIGQNIKSLASAVAYVTKMGSRKNCVLIFGHCYRCVLTIDRKWKIDVAIFSAEP